MPQPLFIFRVTYFTIDRQRRVRVVPAVDAFAAADVVFADGYEVFSSVRIGPVDAADAASPSASAAPACPQEIWEAPAPDLSPIGMLVLSLASAAFLVAALLLWVGYEPLARLVAWAWRLS